MALVNDLRRAGDIQGHLSEEADFVLDHGPRGHGRSVELGLGKDLRIDGGLREAMGLTALIVEDRRRIMNSIGNEDS